MCPFNSKLAPPLNVDQSTVTNITADRKAQREEAYKRWNVSDDYLFSGDNSLG